MNALGSKTRLDARFGGEWQVARTKWLRLRPAGRDEGAGSIPEGSMVEVAGIEPASSQHSRNASTGIGSI